MTEKLTIVITPAGASESKGFLANLDGTRRDAHGHTIHETLINAVCQFTDPDMLELSHDIGNLLEIMSELEVSRQSTPNIATVEHFIDCGKRLCKRLKEVSTEMMREIDAL